ncbi:MAG: acylneuraminate cytidylyltransferase family protein [Ruminiclostridium sp.]
MKTVAFVPIKLNNKRTPGKNLKRFDDGTPLITCLLLTLSRVKGIDEIYVFCSDETIKEYLVNGVRFLKRPQYLDTDQSTPQDIIKEFMKQVDADVYMVSHCTSPFVKVNHFEECISAVKSGEYDSSFTAEKLQRLLWTSTNEAHNFNPEKVPRTQDLEALYAEVSAAYVFSKNTFEVYNRRIGIHPYICEVSGIESIDIDYPEDFDIANAVYMGIINKTK